MTTFSVPRVFAAILLASIVAFSMGCDAAGTNGGDGGEETIVLSDPSNPTEETFEFTYAREDVQQNDSGTNEVIVSADAIDNSTTPDLDTILRDGYFYDGRGDLTSAAVTGATINNQSSTTASKVFPYLNSANIYLNTRSGPLVAQGQVPSSGPATLPPTDTAGDVTSTLKRMSQTTAVLVLEVGDPSNVPTQEQGGDKIGVTLTYRLRAPAQ